MIFTPQQARAIMRGAKTQERRHITPGEAEKGPAYAVGRTYSVQPGPGKAAIGRIEIIDVRRASLGTLTYQDARSEGHRTRDEFYEHWQALNSGVPPTADVWVITFHRAADEPRLLAHRNARTDYTTRRDQAMTDEPEAVDAVTQDRMSMLGTQAWLRDVADRRARERRDLDQQLGQLLAEARKYGIDVSRQEASIRKRLVALERAIEAKRPMGEINSRRAA